MTILVIAEHDGVSIKSATLNAVTAASHIGLFADGQVHLLVMGQGVQQAAEAATHIAGVAKVIHADGQALAHGLAENAAAQVLALADGYSHILFAATVAGRKVAPRVAALLDVAQISDITRVDALDALERPIHAGNALATVRRQDAVKVITVRTTGFDAAPATGGSALVERARAVPDSGKTRLVGGEVARFIHRRARAGGRGLSQNPTASAPSTPVMMRRNFPFS